LRFDLHVIAVALAVALQVQATIPIGEAGIRMAVSDLLLPIGLLYVAIRFFASSMTLQWRTPGVVWWLGAITLSMIVALFVGHHHLGHWSSWAMINKFAGWFALMAYFLIGTAFVRTGGVGLRDEFLTVFLIMAAATAFLNTLAMPWLLNFYTLPVGIEFNRATGAMQNANAFGFLLVVSALLLVASDRRIKVLLPPMLSGLWFSASRGALLTLTFATVCYLFISGPRRLRPLVWPTVTAILAIAIVTAIVIAVNPNRLAEIESGASPIGLLSAERIDPKGETIAERSAQTERALTLIADTPLLGHGLGYFVETTGRTLHNSILWLVVETGLVGALSVSGFLGMAVRSLYLGRDDPFLLGMVVVAIAFAAMSATGEYLYQRHLWLLLGMAMARIPGAQRTP